MFTWHTVADIAGYHVHTLTPVLTRVTQAFVDLGLAELTFDPCRTRALKAIHVVNTGGAIQALVRDAEICYGAVLS